MTARRVTHYALNRGSCVYLGESRVRWLWPCGCTKTETMKIGPRGHQKPMHPNGLRHFCHWWRSSGIRLPRCKKHPEFHSRDNLVPALNLKHPQPKV